MERSEIYREKESLEEFGIDDNNSRSYAIFHALFDFPFLTRWGSAESTMLGLFNDAYYICTLVLLEKRPYFKIDSYKEIASADYQYFPNDRAIIVLSMVSAYLRSLDVITDDIEETVKVIKNQCEGLDGEIYEKLDSVCVEEISINSTTFLPLHFPNSEYGPYWDNYKKFHIGFSDMVTQLSRDSSSKANNVFEAEKQKYEKTIKNLEEQIKKLTQERGDMNQLDGSDSVPEQAFNAKTNVACFTSAQMGILMEAVGNLIESPAPGKSTLGAVVEKISGYKAKTVNQNMKGTHREADKETVAKAIEDKFPKLAAKVRKL